MDPGREQLQHRITDAVSVRTTLRAQWRALLAGQGIRGVLGHLNARTRFRFTGLYRAEPPRLHNLCLYDRENPSLQLKDDITRLEATFCSVVCDRNAPLAIADAARDERAREHPASDSFLSYVGVPVRHGSDRVWGTLCHFDPRPRIVPPGEIDVLESAAAVIADWLHQRDDAC